LGHEFHELFNGDFGTSVAGARAVFYPIVDDGAHSRGRRQTVFADSSLSAEEKQPHGRMIAPPSFSCTGWCAIDDDIVDGGFWIAD
jgi:hypothetical protein